MKIFNIKNYSFTTKTLVVFFLIVLILMFIRNLLIQPKVIEKNLKDEINFISTKLSTIKDIYSIINKENIDESIKSIILKNSDLKSTKIDFIHSNDIKEDFLLKEEEINNQTLLIWSVKLNQNNLFLKYSVDKNELIDKVNLGLFFLLPETIVSIFISFLLLVLIFRKMIKNIDDLTIKLTKSLEEKEILLKEIHHRVKNNFSLIISLIELQEEETKSLETRKVLKNMQERIYAMELLHRKLYESTNLSQINLKTYVIDLINTIKNSYDFKDNVKIDFKIEDIYLNLENCVPYGLILNELVTNSFKYAFKNHSNPKLTIQISKKDENQLLLIVQDNGKGLEKDFDKLSNETLGLKLVNMIVNFQLHGNLAYIYENGAKFTIECKSSLKK